MSENQKRRAKRLVEILIEIGLLKDNNSTRIDRGTGKKHKIPNKEYFMYPYFKEDLTQKLTEALTKLEVEELKLIMKGVKEE